MRELKDILIHLRMIEAYRPTRNIWVTVDMPDLSMEETKQTLLEIWPDTEPGDVGVLLK